jgi:hypothetical protein
MIHNRKSNETICDLIQRPKVLKVSVYRPTPLKECGFLGKPENGLCTWSNNLGEVDTEWMLNACSVYPISSSHLQPPLLNHQIALPTLIISNLSTSQAIPKTMFHALHCLWIVPLLPLHINLPPVVRQICTENRYATLCKKRVAVNRITASSSSTSSPPPPGLVVQMGDCWYGALFGTPPRSATQGFLSGAAAEEATCSTQLV